MPSVMPLRSPARYAPTPMPIPPKITTSRAMIANPRRIMDLLRLASVSTMRPRCEGLMKGRRRSRGGSPGRTQDHVAAVLVHEPQQLRPFRDELALSRLRQAFQELDLQD